MELGGLGKSPTSKICSFFRHLQSVASTSLCRYTNADALLNFLPINLNQILPPFCETGGGFRLSNYQAACSSRTCKGPRALPTREGGDQVEPVVTSPLSAQLLLDSDLLAGLMTPSSWEAVLLPSLQGAPGNWLVWSPTRSTRDAGSHPLSAALPVPHRQPLPALLTSP